MGLAFEGKVLGGAEIDVEPVRLIGATQGKELINALQHLLAALNDPKNVMGLRAKAVNAKKRGIFNNAARTFILREETGCLILEEWAKHRGGPIWERMFQVGTRPS